MLPSQTGQPHQATIRLSAGTVPVRRPPWAKPADGNSHGAPDVVESNETSQMSALATVELPRLRPRLTTAVGDVSVPVPVSLMAVGGLFFVYGIGSAVQTITWLAAGYLPVDLGLICLVIGPMLIRHSGLARMAALVCLWIVMVFAPMAVALLLFAADQPGVYRFNVPLGDVSKLWAVAHAAVEFTLAVWVYRTLRRPDIRRLFARSP